MTLEQLGWVVSNRRIEPFYIVYNDKKAREIRFLGNGKVNIVGVMTYDEIVAIEHKLLDLMCENTAERVSKQVKEKGLDNLGKLIKG